MRVAAHYDDIIRHYGSADGLPQASVNAILQRQDGYLWLGTYGGLTRFDGSRFTVFRSLAKQGPSSDRILSLLEDPRRRLWIGTEDAGLNVLEGDRFMRLPVCEQRCRVGRLLRAGTQVLAATSVGLFAIDIADLRVRRIGPERALDLAATHRGTAFVAGPDGLWRVDGDALTRVARPTIHAWSRPTFLSVIDDTLVLGLADNLYRLHADGWHVFDTGQPLPGISMAVGDAAGRLWLSDNVAHTRRHGRGAMVAESDPAMRSPGNFGSVQSAWVDRDDNLWLGSNGRGLFRIRRARIALLNDRQGRFDLPGLPIAGDGQGGLWLGLNCDGLRHVDADGSVNAWPTLGALRGSCPWSFHRASDGALYIGTSDGQLGVVGSPHGNVERVASWPGNAIVRSIFPIDASTLWVAVGTQTVRVRLDPHRHVIAQREEPALHGMRVHWIAKARSGGHWFAGDQGVVRLVDGMVRERWGVDQGLSSRFARTLFEDADGSLWIGTYGGGVNVVRDGRLTTYDESNGLFDNVASCILEDRAGRLWLSGNRGISMVTREARARAGRDSSLMSVGFTAEDGLVPVETNGGSQSACHLDAKGRLWFPLVSGFATLDPDLAITDAPVATAPVIERVRVAGQPVAFASGLRLQPAARNLEVHYSVPSLTTPDKTRFRFRWTGDSAWTEIGTQRSLYYPVIPWGNAQLQIASRVGGGPWSDQMAVLDLVHPLPWHQRPLVWLALAVAALAATWVGHRGIGWYLRRRAEREARPMRERADQLARDNQLLSDQARRDSLTGVANRRQFDDLLAETALQRNQVPQPVSLLMIDVDEFKRFNDHLGHIAGDECLRAVATAMQQAVPATYALARYGGEEFAVLMPGGDGAQAMALAQRLRERVRALEYPHVPGALSTHVTVSIGVATQLPGHAGRLSDLVASADRAMYLAKRHGRDRIEVAAPRNLPLIATSENPST